MYPQHDAIRYASCMEPSRQEIRAWLHQVLEKTRETPTALAKRAGVAQSTLTRFLNSDDAPMLGLRTIAKIAHAADTSPIGVPAGMQLALRPGLAEPDAAHYVAQEGSPVDRAIAALIGHRRAADPWVLKSRVLEDAGLLPGDILIIDLSETAKAGDVVCAQSYRWSEGRADTVFRIYEPPYLVAASRDEHLRKPLLVDNDRVVIKGVMIGSLRMRR